MYGYVVLYQSCLYAAGRLIDSVDGLWDCILTFPVLFCHQLWNKKFSSLWFCSSCYICFYWTDVHHRLIACFVHLCLATICTWDLLSNSNDWISNNDAWENPKAVYVYNKICTVKSRALDRSTIQFWTLLAKGHST